MNVEEIRHRFRLVATGVAIIVAAIVGGVYANYLQGQDIKHTQRALVTTTARLVKRDCNVVTSTAAVFVDFIRREMAFRVQRLRQSSVPRSVRIFDRSEIDYWTMVTLPRLAKVHAINCGKIIPQTLGDQ